MPVDRMLWAQRMSNSWAPEWPCPRCHSHLTLVEGSFQTINDSDTQLNLHTPGFYSDYITGRFVCLLRCSRKRCVETCGVSGKFETDTDSETGQYYASGTPLAINPAPPLFKVPKDCPRTIRTEVEAAFMLHWCDNAACLNRIRNALELVLSDLKIARSYVDSKHRQMFHSLHKRIELLRSKKPKLGDICDRMLAVKHLGNAGSHAGEVVERDDVFDGFDILERVLHDMYSSHEGELAKMVAQINKRKGPRKAK